MNDGVIEDEVQDGIEEVAEVGEREPDQPADEAAGKGKEKEKDDSPAAIELKRAQAELKAARRAAREHEQNAQYWAEQARTATKAPKKEAPAPEPEEEIDLVSELTTNGVKGFEKVAKKLGFVKHDEVLREIAETRAEITDHTETLRQYPDLANSKSPLFVATATIYNQLKEDPTLANSPKLIAIAARMAKAELAQASTRRRAPAEVDLEEGEESDLGNDDEIEQDPRAARIARQAGDRGRRPTKGNQGEPERLSTLQREMVARFAAVGAPVTEDGYRKRAMAGVRLGGRSGRR